MTEPNRAYHSKAEQGPEQEMTAPSDATELLVTSDFGDPSPQTPSDPTHWTAKARRCIKRELLLVLTLCGVIVGVSVGLLLRLAKPSATTIQLLGLPGTLFLRSLKMLVLPLIAGSIIGGVCSLRADGSDVAIVARQTFLYYLATTSIAVVLGITVVTIFQPGNTAAMGELGNCGSDSKVSSATSSVNSRPAVQAIINVFLELVPANVVEAAASMNVLGVLFFSLFFGITLSRLGPHAESFIRGVDTFNMVISSMVNTILFVSPIGIASLIMEQITASCDVGRTWQALAKFILTVLVGLAVHCLVFLPALYAIVTRQNPLWAFKGFAPALMTAFGTSSSSATLPVTMKCATDNMSVDPNLAQFMLPLGATVNMDGTALYEAVAAIFIAQAHGVPLGFGQTCIIAVVSTLAAVGAAAIPSAGLVTLIMVLQAANLGEYASSIALILVVDWLLDRFRTCVNVMGDSFGVVMLHHLSKKKDSAPRPTETGELDDG